MVLLNLTTEKVMTKKHIEGKILYKNGDSAPLVASLDKVEEMRESRNFPGVDHI